MLVIGKAADPQTLDPAVTIDNNDWTVTYPSYQRLVQYKTDGDKGSTDVEGDLASSWKASDDQKEWTFTLKDNAKFADGTPVTAEAVKLSFERLLKIGQGPAEAFPKDLKIDAPDEHTVRFTLSQPFAPFLYTLANDGASIINPAVLKEHAADDARGFLAQNTAGSGPFMLKSWQKGQQLVLVPNPHYPGNKPNFKRVSVKIIGESASRRLQLSRGDIDIADALLEGNGEVFFNALQHLILPALTLAFVHLGIVARQIRSAMLEQLSEDYIRTARASGLPGWYIVLCYALPNALIPSITVLGLALGDLLYGAVLTETVFAWPGMGAWVVTSIQALDFPAVMGFAVVVSFAYVLVNLVVDLLYLWIDPRIGRGGGE
ncbi:bacterial extracellular solute-binding s, 5 Middle family protein [Escherichia coli 3-267-03_S1_C2]|nr:bacterial extracellular solute-binding s, 5 Middle family protein [Escherichia coli 3-267-03_S1_C2]